MPNRTCSIDGCDRPHYGRGWCKLHYDRWRTLGTTEATRPGPSDRFWAKVDKRGPDECWPWTASLNDHGYGQFRFDGATVRAHRFSYERLVGPIPEGMQLDHTCHNGTGCLLDNACPHRCCVNPAHLDPVSMRVNNLRGDGPAARNAKKTHCPQGHPYSGDNLRQWNGGGRLCRTCQNTWQNAKRHPPTPKEKP